MEAWRWGHARRALSALHTPVIYEGGLSHGFIEQHFSPGETATARTSDIWGCDVMILLTIYSDGFSDIALTHFPRTSIERKVHIKAINKIIQKAQKGGDRYAFIFTARSNSITMGDIVSIEERRAQLISLANSVTHFLDGKDPEVISYDPVTVSDSPIPQVNFQTYPNLEGQEYVISFPHAAYQKVIKVGSR